MQWGKLAPQVIQTSLWQDLNRNIFTLFLKSKYIFFSMLNISTFTVDVILKIKINQNQYTLDNHQVQY